MAVLEDFKMPLASFILSILVILNTSTNNHGTIFICKFDDSTNNVNFTLPLLTQLSSITIV